MPSEADTELFLRDTFKSVWTLELLLHLERQPDRAFTPAELVESLRASQAIVEQGLAELVAGGLIVSEEDERVRYAPANPRLRALVGRVRDDYASRPDAVRRVIISSVASGASAFADAFRLRKD